MDANTNGHFAAIGGDSDKASYGHGVQVIDEDKEFKYVCFGHFMAFKEGLFWAIVDP